MTARRFMVVDWSVLMYLNWHKMRSPNFESRTGLELAEFARNISAHALYLVERVKPDVLVLAVDAPKNWRSDVYARYYLHNVDFREYREKAGIWVVQFDRKTYLVTYRQDMGKWEFKKLPKADVLALELEDPTQWRTWKRERSRSGGSRSRRTGRPWSPWSRSTKGTDRPAGGTTRPRRRSSRSWAPTWP